MNNSYLIQIFIIPLNLFIFILSSSQAQITSEGREFWFGFMNNRPDIQANAALYIYLSSDSITNCTIRADGVNFLQNIQLQPNQPQTIGPLPNNLVNITTGQVGNLGVLVTSGRKINCFIMNQKGLSTDGSLVLPVDALGTEYLLLSSRISTEAISVSQFLIVGVNNNTQIDITLPNGSTLNPITLNRGQTFYFESTSDLTGTRVRARNGIKFAVFSGNRGEGINGSSYDHIFEQQYALNTWGRDFIVMPIIALRNQQQISRVSTYKIIAQTNNTAISIAGVSQPILNSGRSMTFRRGGAFRISSNNPIQVAQYSESMGMDNTESDPFMLMISPINQNRKRISFIAPGNFPGITNHFINIATKNNCQNAISLNNTPIASSFTLLPNDSFAIATIRIPAGTNILNSSDRRCGFNAYVYGGGSQFESYGYSAGVSLDPLSFDFVGDSICVGSIITFYVNYSPYTITSYNWEFGDGEKSNHEKPSHKYSRGGTFNVKLIVRYDNGFIDSVTSIIKVTELIAKIKYELISKSCETAEYSFSDNSYINEGKIVKWLWDFGDGEISSSKNPKHKFTKQGSFRVILTVTSDNGCIDRDVVIVNNYLKLEVEAGSELEICSGEEVQLNGSAKQGMPSYKFKWEPSEELSNSEISNPTAKPTKTTVFYLTVTDSLGCTATDSVKITVKPQPEINIQDNLSICAGDSIQIGSDATNAPEPFIYKWYPKEGLSSDSIAKPIAKPIVTTTYTLKVTSANGCSSEFKITVRVNPIPNSDAGPDVMICYGDSALIGNYASCGVEPFKYEWIPPNNLSTPNSARTIAFPKITTEYVLKVTDGIGRVAYDTVLVKVNPDLKVSAGDNKELCYNDVDILTGVAIGGTPPYNFEWFEKDSLVGNTKEIKIGAQNTTKYTLKVTDANGCISYNSVQVTVNPLPTVFAGSDTTICAGSEVKIGNFAENGTPPYTYKWEPQNFLNSPSEAITIAKPTRTITYILTVTDANGCQIEDTVTIFINPVPAAVAGPDLVICYGDTVQIGGDAFCGAEPYQYEWAPNQNISATNISMPYVFPKETTTYIVKITDSLGRSASDTVTIYVNPLPALKGSPNVSICKGNGAIIGSEAISGSPPYKYSWEPSNLVNPTDSAYVFVNPESTTLFIQKLTDNNGCSVFDSILVTVTNPPKATIDGSKKVCPDKLTPLSVKIEGGTPPFTYLWEPDEYIDNIHSKNPVVNPIRPIKYSVVVRDANNCTDTATHSIELSNISSLIKIPEIITSAKAKNLKIPVYLDDENDLNNCLPDSLYLRMQWDATLFNPTGISIGKITKTLSSDCNWDVEIVIPKLNQYEKRKALFEIIGDAMLGRKDTTDLIITDLRWYGILSDYNFINGRLIITDICGEGGPRFLDYQDFCGIISIAPNPAKDNFELTLQLTSDVRTEAISIIDILGRPVYQLKNSNDQYTIYPKDFKVLRKTLNIDASEFETGYYNVIYFLDGRTYSQKLLIIK